MKTTKLITLGVLLGTCAFASAQGGPPGDGPRPGGKRPVPAAVLKKFDKDGDGKLSEDERKAMQDARQEERKAMNAKYDKDGDGKLSEDERAAMRADMEAQHKALLEKYDADKNGKLDPEEAEAAIAAGEKLPPMRGPGGKGGPKGKGGPGAPPEGGAPPPAAE